MAKTERPEQVAPRVSSQAETLVEIALRYNSIGDFLYLYEHHRRKYPLEDYRTWPEISIAQALAILDAENYSVKVLDDMPADMVFSYGKTKKFFDAIKADVPVTPRDIKVLFLEHKAEFGFSIPLLIELMGEAGPDNTSRVAFLYAWINCVRHMHRKDWIASQKEIKLRKEDDPNTFEFEIECTLDQAAVLERYIQIKVDAYNYWHSYTINRFPKQKSRDAPLPSSEVITELRSAYMRDGLKVPRSLVARALTSCVSEWQRWSDVTSKKGNRPDKLLSQGNNTFSVSGSGFNFVESNTALSIGDAKRMHISNVIRGEIDSSRAAKFLIVIKKADLTYSVKGKYKK